MSTGDIFGEFSRKPSLILTYFGMASVVFVTTAMLTWLPRYFQDTQLLDEKAAGFKTSIIMVLAIVGAPLGGFITDRWRKKQLKARLYFPALSTALSAVFLFLSLNYFAGTAQFICFLFFGVSVVAFVSAASSVTQDVVHAGLRAVSYSIAVVVQNLLGASTAPVIIGSLYDKTDIHRALQILPAVLILGSLFFFAASWFYERDLKKVEIIDLEVAA